MKKKLIRVIALFAIMLLFTSPVFALTVNTNGNNEKSSNAVVPGVTTLELVEKKLCEIPIKDTNNNSVGLFTKELTNFDANKKEATLTLTVKNLMKKESFKKPVEIFLVLDNSDTMKEKYNGKSKIDFVSETADSFANSLFSRFENVKIGIVSFSSVVDNRTSVDDPPVVWGTQNDAKLVLGLSNSLDNVKSKIAEYKTDTAHGAMTNIEAGLNLAEANFSKSTDSEKIVILLSDGVPNLSLGTNKFEYSGTTATNTKNKLVNMDKKGYNIFSVLMGYDQASTPNPQAPMIADNSRHMTNYELLKEIFGTTSKPTVGNFFFINYDKLYGTVNTDIYNKLTSQKDTNLKNLVIKDFFPKEIVDNFNFELVKSANIGTVSTKIDTSDNSITWKIDLLKAEEVATLSYKLTLKDNYDKAIVNKILPTNSKVDLSYEYDGKKGSANSTVSSTVRVKYSESSKDDTTAKKPIPQTGINSTVFIVVISACILAYGIIKIKQINKLK